MLLAGLEMSLALESLGPFNESRILLRGGVVAVAHPGFGQRVTRACGFGFGLAAELAKWNLG